MYKLKERVRNMDITWENWNRKVGDVRIALEVVLDICIIKKARNMRNE